MTPKVLYPRIIASKIPAYFLVLKGGPFDALPLSNAAMLVFVMAPAKSISFTEGLLITFVITKLAEFKRKKPCWNKL